MIGLLRLQGKEAVMWKPDPQDQARKNTHGRYATSFVYSRVSLVPMKVYLCHFAFCLIDCTAILLVPLDALL